MGYVLPPKPKNMTGAEYLAMLERTMARTRWGRFQWRWARRAVERKRRRGH